MQFNTLVLSLLSVAVIEAANNPLLYDDCAEGSSEYNYCQNFCKKIVVNGGDGGCQNYDFKENYCGIDVLHTTPCTPTQCNECHKFANKGNFCYCGGGNIFCEVPKKTTPKPLPNKNRKCTSQDTTCIGDCGK